MKRIILLIICLSCGGSVFAQKTKTTLKKQTSKPIAPKVTQTDDESKLAILAITAVKNGQYKTASVYLTRILEVTPDPVSYSLRATINGLQGNTKDEIEDYYQALRYSYQDVEALWQGGFAFGSKRYADTTIAAITKFLKTNPNNTEAYIVRGWAYRIKGNADPKISEAVADFTKAIELKGDEPLFYYYRGESNLYQNNAKNAAEDFNNYLKAKPDDELVMGLRANALMSWGDLAGATADLDELAKRNPDDIRFLHQRARAFRKMKDYEKAIKDYTTLLKINSKDNTALFFRGDVYENANNYEEAIADYSELIKRNPDDVSNYYQRLRCYKAIKDKEKTFADYRMIIKLSPENEEIKKELEGFLKGN